LARDILFVGSYSYEAHKPVVLAKPPGTQSYKLYSRFSRIKCFVFISVHLRSSVDQKPRFHSRTFASICGPEALFFYLYLSNDCLTVSHLRYTIGLCITMGEFIMAHTSMLHVRVDDELKADAAEKLASFGLTVSDAVRILLTRVTKEGGLPAGLTADPEAHDTWFRDKVKEALADVRPTVPHQQVMDAAQALIDGKRRA
jgi:DNA-damage-inducible protein J